MHTEKWTGILSDTRIRFGVNWYYGGQYNGQGRYIGNADVFFEVKEIGGLEKFHVAAHFDNPLNVGAGVAHLAGSMTIGYYEYGSLSDTARTTSTSRATAAAASGRDDRRRPDPGGWRWDAGGWPAPSEGGGNGGPGTARRLRGVRGRALDVRWLPERAQSVCPKRRPLRSGLAGPIAT